MTDSELEAGDPEIQKLVAKLRELGGRSGNTSLMRGLRWDKDHFYEVRNRALAEGRVTKARGKGGVTLLVDPMESEELGDEPADVVAREEDLYGAIQAVLESDWVKDAKEVGVRSIGVLNTGRQGRRKTGGKWTRPDLAMIVVQELEFFPQDHFEIITFEVKRASDLNPTGVYEALSHRRAAHSAILVVCAESESELEKQEWEETTEVARGHGIGVIKVVGHVGDYEHWETVETAVRFEPDPIRANRFIEDQLGELHTPLREHLNRFKSGVLADAAAALRAGVPEG